MTAGPLVQQQLNPQRAAEETQGRVRWLRPEFQNPQNSLQKQELLAQYGQALEAVFDSKKSLLKPEQTNSAPLARHLA